MAKANPVSGTLTGTPGAGALPKGTSLVLLTLVLAAAWWIVLGFPPLAQAGDAEDGTPLWSADISVVDLQNRATGAVQASDFSNQGGSAGLTAKWLYHYEYDGRLRLSFTEGADVEGHLLQVGHLTLSFADNTSGNSSFTWDDVDVDWEAGQTLAARVVTMTDGNIPATGLPKVTGRLRVHETLTADTSDIADQDGLDSVSWTYQWQADGADIALATGSSYTPGAAELGSVITVKVTFTDDQSDNESLTSKPTAAVLAANTAPGGTPTISGDPKVRQTLSADVSGITDADGLASVSYVYQWTAGDADIEDATGSEYKLTSAELGKAVKVMVSFLDDAGNSESLSSAATVAVENGPPDTPEIHSARRAHVGMLQVDWNDVDDVTSYELQYHQYDMNWLTLPHEKLNYQAHYNGSYALVDGLGYETGYSFRVRALNDAGASEWSGTYTNGHHPRELYGPDTSARPRLAGSPSKPQELSASGAGHLEVELSWSAPEESGDSDVAGYRVEYKPVGTKIWSFLAVTEETSYRHTGLSPDRNFYYRVSAFNSDAREQNTERVRGISTVKAGVGKWQPRIHRVADDWELIPEGAGLEGGDRFRLMFITAESRDANSDSIEDYNKFVQDAAAAGHADIQEYSADFRVLASTVAVDAMGNTGTNWTESHPGLPVYWLKGTRVADDYKDLYDGEWDDPRFAEQTRRTRSTYFEAPHGWVTREEIRTYYNFDANRGEYIYTDEHGVSMYNRHCHGYYWNVYGPATNNEYQYDLNPCISTGTNNDGTAQRDEYLENCGSYTTLGNPCRKVTFGRPTRILPEEGGELRPVPEIDPTLDFGYRESKPAFSTKEREAGPEWSVWLIPMSEGVIATTSLFYAVSPIFEIEITPALSVADAEATEGDDATLDFTVTLYPAAEAEVTVDYATQDGTAIAGSDYTSTSGTLTFAAGDTAKTVSVPIIDDTAEDDGENFKLLLSNVSGAKIRDAEATGTIRNTEDNAAAGGAPTITGTPRAGETLTAGTSGITDANGLTNVSWQYQWLAEGADIGSATGSTYTVASGDVGKRLSVRVTFNDDGGNAETLTSAQTVVVAATVPTAPQSLSVATGDQDQELEASWQAPISNGGSAVTGYRVQWKDAAGSWDTAADVSEATATGTTHTISGLTGGVEYSVQVIATNIAGDGPASTEVKSTPAGGVSEQVVEPENTAPTGLPTIGGTPQVDQTLTADTSPIDDADGLTNVSWQYQWIAGGSAIGGATGSTHTLTYSEQGQTIRVRVTFTDDEGNEETLTSIATAAVAAAPNRGATGAPAIGGTPQVDQTLTADTANIVDEDGLTNVSYSYQWIAGGSDIDGATGASHTLNASELGQTIQVRVTFTDDRNNAETLTSIATAEVEAAPVTLTVLLKVAAPASHDGSSEFTFEIEFSEEFGLSYRTLRDHAFNVTGGSVERAQRTDKPSNIPWRITVKPQGAGDVAIELPATTNCGAAGAICTGDGRKLSNSLNITVSGLGQ